MPSRPRKSPYREGAPPARPPPSPDVDPSLLAPSPVTGLLVRATFLIPVVLLLTWLTDMPVRGCGPTHIETRAERIGTTIVSLLVAAVLIALHVRHGRRQRAALRALQSTDEKDASAQPGAHDVPRANDEGKPRADVVVRVASSLASSESEGAGPSEPAAASDSERELKARRRGR